MNLRNCRIRNFNPANEDDIWSKEVYLFHKWQTVAYKKNHPEDPRGDLWYAATEAIIENSTTGEVESCNPEDICFIDRPLLNDNQIKKVAGLHDIGLEVRTYNCLRSAKVDTLSQVLLCGDNYLLRLRSFGKQSLKDLDRCLDDIGLQRTKDKNSSPHDRHPHL
jgi:hypothetical protein